VIVNYGAESSEPPPPYSESGGNSEDHYNDTLSPNKDAALELARNGVPGVCNCNPAQCGCGCAKVTMAKNITVVHGKINCHCEYKSSSFRHSVFYLYS
jgi:hypothetical protein